MTSALGPADRARMERRVRQFRQKAGAESVPVDAFRLADRLRREGLLRVERVEDTVLRENGDALVARSRDGGRHVIFTAPLDPDWKKTSPRRRANFTMAHELGHICCGHTETPDAAKTPAVRAMEDAEADAFAAELLVPREALARFCSVKEAADSLWVSESAVRRRMRDTGVLPSRRACPRCGFSRIPPAAAFCRMCGEAVKPLYPPWPEDVPYLPPAPAECPACGAAEPAGPGGECLNCGAPKRNHCLPEYNQAAHWCPTEASRSHRARIASGKYRRGTPAVADRPGAKPATGAWDCSTPATGRRSGLVPGRKRAHHCSENVSTWRGAPAAPRFT